MSVDCGPPVVPHHGSLENYTSTTEGSEVFYSCDQHLVPEGRMRAVCTRNGWTPNPADLNCSVGMLTDNKIPIQLLAHFYVCVALSHLQSKFLLYGYASLLYTHKYVLSTFLPQLIASMGAVL